MIQGYVNHRREATVRLSIVGSQRTIEVDAVIDTGFDGSLMLPSPLIQQLGLHWREAREARLADDSIRMMDVYTGTVVWNQSDREISVFSGSVSPLIGMNLLYGSVLNAEIVDGGKVTLIPLP